jgi:hypothetical protein
MVMALARTLLTAGNYLSNANFISSALGVLLVLITQFLNG